MFPLKSLFNDLANPLGLIFWLLWALSILEDADRREKDRKRKAEEHRKKGADRKPGPAAKR